MTVGLVLNNRDYGVALADSMVTIGDYRKGDTANKLLHITAKNFYGAMVGAGDALNIFATFENTRDKKPKSIVKLVEQIRNFSLQYGLDIDRQALESREKINKVIKPFLGKDEEIGEDDDYEDGCDECKSKIKKSKKRIIGNLEDYVTSAFVAAVYDKDAKRIKKYGINAAMYGEDPFFETIIGSGTDSAELELMRLMSGAPLSKLHKCEIAFFGLCAYVRATQNVGVGGIPKIALIDKESSRIVNREDCIALANITAAYHADLLSRDYAEHNAELIFKEQGNYEEVAKVLSMTEFSLKNHLAPLDSWLNLGNSLRYGQNENCSCDGKCKEGEKNKDKGCDGKCAGDCEGNRGKKK